ncbi:hypothetical protein ACFZDK_50035 [Streptomyces sp. NPDC007901]|uniref:hypothetical protein n=1 Tax=Streptomyces sp. NPDC007901 TaxID=3364785 RepID=UPI0036E9C6DA
MTLIVSQVGTDVDLRRALEDLKIGRYLAARDLLVRTGWHWSLYTIRTQLLAAGDGAAGVIKAWLDEDPQNPHALIMWARALTRTAVVAHHSGAQPELVGRAMNLARQACLTAIGQSPACPVPWIDLLRLTQLPVDPVDFDPYADRRPLPWNLSRDPGMPHRGPWPLLHEINRRHPGSREGHHRMREFFLHRGSPGTAEDFSGWLVMGRVVSPDLLLLPLYALMDVYRQRHGNGEGTAIAFWQEGRVSGYAVRAYDEWFDKIPATEYPWVALADLSHLAFTLVACGEEARAGAVFEAMGPYTTAEPWRTINASLGRSADWRDEFVRTRVSVLRRRR